MEVKKSPKADLEGKKSTGLLIGYVLALAVMFIALIKSLQSIYENACRNDKE